MQSCARDNFLASRQATMRPRVTIDAKHANIQAVEFVTKRHSNEGQLLFLATLLRCRNNCGERIACHPVSICIPQTNKQRQTNKDRQSLLVEYFFLCCGIEHALMKGSGWGMGQYYFCIRKFLQRKINNFFVR